MVKRTLDCPVINLKNFFKKNRRMLNREYRISKYFFYFCGSKFLVRYSTFSFKMTNVPTWASRNHISGSKLWWMPSALSVLID